MMRIVFGIVAGVATMALLNTGAGLANEQTSKKDATEAGMQMMGGMSQSDAPRPGK